MSSSIAPRSTTVGWNESRPASIEAMSSRSPTRRCNFVPSRRRSPSRPGRPAAAARSCSDNFGFQSDRPLRMTCGTLDIRSDRMDRAYRVLARSCSLFGSRCASATRRIVPSATRSTTHQSAIAGYTARRRRSHDVRLSWMWRTCDRPAVAQRTKEAAYAKPFARAASSDSPWRSSYECHVGLTGGYG